MLRRNVKVDEETYDWIVYLARRTGRSLAMTVRAMALRTQPEDIGAIPEPKRPEMERERER